MLLSFKVSLENIMFSMTCSKVDIRYFASFFRWFFWRSIWVPVYSSFAPKYALPFPEPLLTKIISFQVFRLLKKNIERNLYPSVQIFKRWGDFHFHLNKK